MKKSKTMTLILAVLLMLSSLFNLSVITKGERVLEPVQSNYNLFLKNGWISEDITLEEFSNFTNPIIELENFLDSNENYEKILWDDNASPNHYPDLYDGDILITNGTSSYGITGHAGIAVGRRDILHISGPGKHPEIISQSGWHARYTENSKNSYTKIYRHRDGRAARDAADWAYDTYARSRAIYKITRDLSSTEETYCSKIVWQAYHYGPRRSEVRERLSWDMRGIITPYELVDEIYDLDRVNYFRANSYYRMAVSY